LETIGDTPLVRLKLETPALVLAKVEYGNPGGSIKDRPALFMVEEAERSGELKPGGTIIEASSGNQGIALAMIGAAKGYKVIIAVPHGTSIEKVGVLRAFGAEVVMGSGDPDDQKSYHAKAQHLLKTIPNAFMPNQYVNKQNPLAHYKTTGPEIWEQTNGTVTHLVAAKGSCGTVSGIGRYLKEKNQNIRVIAVDASGSEETKKKYRIEGIGVGVDDNLDRSVVDEYRLIEGCDAFEMAKKLTREYGIFAGLSSGASMCAVIGELKNLGQNDVLVVIFADSGRSYLQKLFGEEFD